MKQLILLGSVFASVNSSASDLDLKQLFPKEADLFVANSGLTRFDVPAGILEQCRADLSDLRIFDTEGREVPFLLDLHPVAAAALVTTAEVTPLRADQEKFQRDQDGPETWRERYTLPVPEGAPAGQAWELLLDARASQFVRRVEVTDAKDSALVKDGSVFRLPAMRAERTRIALPVLKTSSINVVISGQEHFYLEPRFRFESSRRLVEERQIVVALPEIGRSRAGGKTILELQRPPGIVPQSLRFQTSSHVFNRPVDIYDWRSSSAANTTDRLGSGTLFRVAGAVPLENLEIPLAPAHGDRLRLEISDGDSPELASLQVSAALTPPTLIFDLSSKGPGTPAGVLRFGGARAGRPHYDLANLSPANGMFDAQAEVAASLSSLGNATLGAVRDNSSYRADPALAFAMRPGAEADVRLYSHRRRITVADARDGLSRLELGASDLALLRSDLADIRIVDGQSRQWPYLIEPRARFGWEQVSIVKVEQKGTVSRLRVQLPSAPFLIDLLEVDISNPYFDRSFKLVGTDVNKTERVLAVGRLARGADESAAVRTIAIDETWVTALELQVDNGSDAPLELRRVRAREPQPEIYLVAPPGEYSLLLGNSDEVAPSYEITRVRPLILSVSSATAAMGPLQPNPQFQRSARLTASGTPERLALWGTLGLSVVVLSFLTFRMARRENAPGDSQPR